MKLKFHMNKKVIRRGVNVAFAMLLLTSLFVTGQTSRKADWREFSRKTSSNFYEVQRDFKQYWQNKPMEKGKGFKVFKRWEEYVAPRVYPSGNMLLPSTTYSNFVAWKQQSDNRSVSGAKKNDPPVISNWTALGPFVKPTGYDAGMGRVDWLRFDPTNSNIMYVGTPDGGLWKTVNGGSSWTTNTDFLPVIGCADLAINPTNTQIMYLATGNFENDRRTIGVLKSTNGGATWNPTGIVFEPQEDYRIRRMIMDPTNPQIMMIATDGGVFRTTDGWTTFNSVIPGAPNLFDIVFKPGDPNTVYAAGKEFYKSTNKGVSWTKITSGLPQAASVSRIMLGVSPASPVTVYAVMGDTERGFLGLYRSTNSGTSFTLRSSAPNILNSSKDGSGTGGQATHDLAIAISPVNANIVTVGGISQWRSNNGGANWTLLSYWLGDDPAYPGIGDGPPDYVHADVQSIQYLPGSGNIMFTTCDGGVSKSVNNGANWTDITGNISVSQEYSIALSATSSDIMVAGLQDIGTVKYQAGGSSIINGGDGLDAFIDRTNDLRIVTSNPFGAYAITTDGTDNRTDVSGIPESTDFFAAISQDPVNANTVYAGGRPALYRSTNFTSTWTMLGTPPGTDNILEFVVAPSNNSIIYAIKADAFSRSTNGGSTWTNKTGTLPVASAQLTNLTISDTDPDDVWVTFSGYEDGVKVFETKNGGTTWTNVSAGLPNVPINTIVFQKGDKKKANAVYIGADIGVYYLNSSLDACVPFFTNLPNCAVRDLEIFYPTGKLRAATYGRGAWETNLNGVETFTITASAGRDGSISPDGKVDVIRGANQTFTIMPDAGYMIEDVTVDGKTSVGPVSTYTFTNVTEKHTIKASFTDEVAKLGSMITFNTGTNTLHVAGTGGKAPYTYSSDDVTYRQDNTGDGGHDFMVTGSTYKIYVKDRNEHVYSTSGNISSVSRSATAGIAGRNSGEPAITINTSIAPNPSEHQFTLRVTSNNTTLPIRVRVLDMNQRVMFTSQGAVKGTYNFGENFKAGTYVVEITQGNERKTVKVIKK